MQPLCRSRHTAFPYDGQEDAKFSEIHSSLLKMISIVIIHFLDHSAIAIYPWHRSSES
jgi:hypothetical protein